MGKYLLWVALMGLFFQSPPKDVTKPELAVRFFMPPKEPFEPIMHISLVVRASSEGEAVMKAFRHCQNHIASISMDKLEFYDAQEKAK